MAVMTSEIVRPSDLKAPFSMIEEKGLWTRLNEQLSQAVAELKGDPRAFLHDLFFDDDKDLQRSKRIRLGWTVGLLTNLVLIGFIVVLGLHPTQAKGQITKNDSEYVFEGWVPEPSKPESKQPEAVTKPSEMPKGSGNQGDTGATGGGGMNQPTPPVKGIPPQMAALPPVMSPIATSLPNPSLPMNPTLEGPPTPPPPPGEKIGSPTGVENGSGGPGKGNGIGTGAGNGVGDAKGNGAGENLAGTGGGKTPGSPNGGAITPNAIDYSLLAKMPESTGITWIRRVRPIVTPEAQANLDYGYILLEATFNADGTITDIRIRQSMASMDESAIEAVRQIKFRPATIRGVPITLRRVPIKVPVTVSK